VRLPNTIETVSGLEFDYTAPVVNLQDVAHGLAHTCRFAGHTSRFYSVAEHSVLVANLVRKMAPHLALAALWHDAHEAYLVDLPTPLKAIIGPEYGQIAERIDRAVYDYLGLDRDVYPLRHPAIKLADELAVMYEASIFMHGPGWEFTRQMDHPQARAASRMLGLGPANAAGLFRDIHFALLPKDDHLPPHMTTLLGDMNPVVA
jgi:hypothetical protein